MCVHVQSFDSREVHCAAWGRVEKRRFTGPLNLFSSIHHCSTLALDMNICSAKHLQNFLNHQGGKEDTFLNQRNPAQIEVCISKCSPQRVPTQQASHRVSPVIPFNPLVLVVRTFPISLLSSDPSLKPVYSKSVLVPMVCPFQSLPPGEGQCITLHHTSLLSGP